MSIKSKKLAIRAAVCLLAIILCLSAAGCGSGGNPGNINNSGGENTSPSGQAPGYEENPEWFANFQNVGEMTDGLYPVEQNSYWGFADKDGNIVIECLYDSYKPFEYGLAPVSRNEKWGVIDKTGKTVVTTAYSGVDKITAELIVTYNSVKNSTNKYFVFTADGTGILSDKSFGILNILADNKRIIVRENVAYGNGSWGDFIRFYDFSGKLVFDGLNDKVTSIGDIVDGWALITGKKGMWNETYANYINADGEYFANTWFEEALPWNEGKTAVSSLIDGKSRVRDTESALDWYIIDKTGNKVFDLPDGALTYTELFQDIIIGKMVERVGTRSTTVLFVASAANGNVLFPSLKSAETIAEEKYIIIQDSDSNLYGIIDGKGSLIKEIDYNAIEYEDGKFTYTRGSQTGEFDLK